MIGVADYAGLVGREVGVSEWMTIDQARIDAFAEATGDRQFIHVDPVRAAATPLGGTVAHGFLMLSLYPALRAASDAPRIAGVTMAINYGGDRVRFVEPVRAGVRVRGRFTLVSFVEKAPGRWQETIAFVIELPDGRPAVVGEWISQFLLDRPRG